MAKITHARKTPFWRKILTLVMLPALVFIWMTGWILTQIGSQNEPSQIRQETMLPHYKSSKNEETKESNKKDNSRIAYNPEIVA